jgi:nicotinamide-nucleotide adenylyltransferase
VTLRAQLAALRRSTRPTMVVEAQDPEPDHVALVSGSFDPITIAHAALADAAAGWADLVVVLYSPRTVPKPGDAEPPLLSETERLRGMEAFCLPRPKREPGLCSHGLLVEQVQAARVRFPQAELRLAIGSDKLLQVLDPRWYEDPTAALDTLFEHAVVMYAVRDGEEAAVTEALSASGARWRHRVARLDVSPEVAAVSSSLVRSMARRGQDVRHLVPPEVLPLLPPSLPGVGIRPGWE